MEKMEEGKKCGSFHEPARFGPAKQGPCFSPLVNHPLFEAFSETRGLRPQVSWKKDLRKNQCIDDGGDHLDLCPCINNKYKYIYT